MARAKKASSPTPSPLWSKAQLKEELVAALEETLRALQDAHKSTTAGMTHPDNKPENDKDTRAIEMSYLARGQAMRIEEFTLGVSGAKVLNVAECSRVQLGALVHTEDTEGSAAHYLVAPEGGGVVLSGGVKVVTPKSPLGKALMGKEAGDETMFVAGGVVRGLNLLRVS